MRSLLPVQKDHASWLSCCRSIRKPLGWMANRQIALIIFIKKSPLLQVVCTGRPKMSRDRPGSAKNSAENVAFQPKALIFSYLPNAADHALLIDRFEGKGKAFMGNQIRTTLLMAIMTVFVLWVGNLLGGRQGMVMALVLAAGMNFFSYWYSDKLVLRMYRAREATATDAPRLYEIVSRLTRQAGLPMPKLYVIPQDSPNAFATGRNPEHAAVAVTEGLLQRMEPEEIAGVLAHELSHVKNRDILIGSIAATMAGAIMLLATMARWSAIFGGGRNDREGGGLGAFGLIAMSIIAPMAAMLIQMAISRSREYQADATGAALAGTPEGLARALEKLGAYSKRLPMNANPSTAHMFIVNPLSGKSFQSLFSTHPPLEDRIARLRGTRPPQAQDGPPPPPNADRRQAEGKAFWDRLSR
jgi:heat shock protein HtpX